MFLIKRNVESWEKVEKYTRLAEEARQEFERTLPDCIWEAHEYHRAAEELGLDEDMLLSVAGEVGTLKEALLVFELAARIKRGERVSGDGGEDTMVLDTMVRLYQVTRPGLPLVMAVAWAIKDGF